MIVGLTGGIASGKSTATDMFRDLGAYVVDADVWARRVVEPGSEALALIVSSFGEDVLQSDGSLNRACLGQIIFHDEAARRQLNEIVHPRVRRGMKDETKEYLKDNPGEPVIWDVPLLFEGETLQLVDRTIVVYVDEATQLHRLMARNGFGEAEALTRIRAQIPLAEKRKRADYVVDNGGPLNDTREQVKRIWQEIRKMERMDPASSS